jgi:predicted nucleic acid-binding protein
LKSLFIDTGGFLAKEIAADQHHGRATGFWRRIEEHRPRLYSSEHVLDETTTLLARRTSYAWAAEWGRDVLASGIELIPAEKADLSAAFIFMKKFADQSVSYTDCISFVLMKKQGLRDVCGFDGHFIAAGFRLLPADGE